MSDIKQLTQSVKTGNRLLKSLCKASSGTGLGSSFLLCDVNEASLRPINEQIVIGSDTFAISDVGGDVGKDWGGVISPSLGVDNGLATKLNINAEVIYYLQSAFGTTDLSTSPVLVEYNRNTNTVDSSNAVSVVGSPGVITDLTRDYSKPAPDDFLLGIEVGATGIVGIVPINRLTGSVVLFGAQPFSEGPGGGVTLNQIAAGAVGGLRTVSNIGNSLIYIFYANDVFDTGSGNKGGIAEFDLTANRLFVRTVATDIPVDLVDAGDRVGVQMDYDFDNDHLLLNTGQGTIYTYDLSGNLVSSNSGAIQVLGDGLVYIPETAYPTQKESTPFNQVVTESDGVFATENYTLNWEPYTITGEVVDCSSSGDTKIHNLNTVSTSGAGVIPTGAIAYSIANTTGTDVWQFNGTTIPSNVTALEDDVSGREGAFFNEIPYDGGGTQSLLITYII